MQSQNREQFLTSKLNAILILVIALTVISLILFRNLFFQSTYILKNLGESSFDPAIAFINNKPTFLEFYAEWCEVCKEMAPKISELKEQYDKDVNFVFLNVDNPAWEKYIKKFDVNGIPQVNIFDRSGNLISTFIGKQKEITLSESIANLKNGVKINEEFTVSDFSKMKNNKNFQFNPRSHG